MCTYDFRILVVFIEYGAVFPVSVTYVQDRACVLEHRVGEKGEVPIWTEVLLVRRKGKP